MERFPGLGINFKDVYHNHCLYLKELAIIEIPSSKKRVVCRCTYILDLTSISLPCFPPGGLIFVIELDQYAPGRHNVTITATDVFGQNISQTIPFRVPPTLSKHD